MEVLERAAYVGPSLYASFPVMRLRIDLGPLEDWPSVRLGDAFTNGLLEALPGLHEHGCSYREPGGFVRRLTEDEGTWMGHILEHVAIELQVRAGEQVTFGKTRSAPGAGIYDVVYAYKDRKVGLEAGKLAMTLLHSLTPAELHPKSPVPDDFDFAEELERFIRYVQRTSFGPSTAALVRAAVDRDIPWIRLNEYSLVQFGHGHHQKRIQATITSNTSHIAVDIASDKDETNQILADLGLPVPQQRLVYASREAVRAAERIGHPVVVKPLNANHGRGVSIGLQTSDEVRSAYEQAREHSRGVLVETYLAGLDHRILVIDGEVVAVSKRVPGHVIGDGKRTIEALVDEVNADPRRGIGHEKVLTRLEFDHQADRLLKRAGYGRDSIPADGVVVSLRSTANLSTGGTAVDMTDVIHPDNRDMAQRAALAIGLDVCGVDFITEDITQSHKEIGGGICELNAAPGFRMHTSPSEGTPRDAAGAVIDMLFPPNTPTRVPIYAVTGTNGKTTTVRMLAHIHKMSGSVTGLTTTDGVYIDGQRTVEGDMTGPIAAQMALRDPATQVAVLETARGGLLRAGMGVRRVDYAACLNVKPDHLGLKGIDTLEQLAEVKRIVIESATDTAVLNADDELCLRMASFADVKHVCYVTMNPTHDLVREHIRSGGRAVGLEAGLNGHMVTIYDHGSHIPLLWTHLIPATLEGRALHNVQNAMFAAALAYSGGVGLEDIRHGLRTFDTSFFQAPGRLNMYNEHPFRVLLDYAHNPHAMEAICGLVTRLEVSGRRICSIAAPGDRRDEDIKAIARHAAGVFDHYICRRDDNLRGRGERDVPEMMRAEFLAAGVPESAIEIVEDEEAAVDHALASAQPDDLVVLFADALTRTWKQVIHFKPDAKADAVARPEERAPTPLPEVETVQLDIETSWVRDERGVILAPEESD